MPAFKIKGVRAEIDFSFLIMMLIYKYIMTGEEFIMLFSVCIVHEAGHIFAFEALGEKIGAIRLTGFGIILEPYNKLGSVKRDVAVLLAGPLFNIICGAVCMRLGADYEASMFHIATGLFHLAPLEFTDGARVAYYAAERIWGEERAKKITRAAAVICFAAMIIFILK